MEKIENNNQEERRYVLEEERVLADVMRRKIREVFGEIAGVDEVQFPEDFGAVVRKSFGDDKKLEAFLEQNNIVWRDLCEEAEQEVEALLEERREN